MNLQSLLAARVQAGRPVRVGLIGAGKFGSMFLAQVPHTAGLEIVTIADLDPARAKQSCNAVGWDEARIAKTRFTRCGSAAATVRANAPPIDSPTIVRAERFSSSMKRMMACLK